MIYETLNFDRIFVEIRYTYFNKGYVLYAFV